MGRRAFRIALLVFQAVWLNIIVPGHTRGVVALPGTASPSPACCCCGGERGDASHHAPVGDPAGHCAICYFAACLFLPPPIDFAPSPRGLAEILDPPAPRSATSVRSRLVLRDRAPPFDA